jgi:hypothetical protein
MSNLYVPIHFQFDPYYLWWNFSLVNGIFSQILVLLVSSFVNINFSKINIGNYWYSWNKKPTCLWTTVKKNEGFFLSMLVVDIIEIKSK